MSFNNWSTKLNKHDDYTKKNNKDHTRKTQLNKDRTLYQWKGIKTNFIRIWSNNTLGGTGCCNQNENKIIKDI